MRAAAECGRALGYGTRVHDRFLDGEAAAVGAALAADLVQGPTGMHIWGGETTVHLPAHPGRGGRNQTLALAAALALKGVPGVALLAAGTDGTDGPGADAGALVDGSTVERGTADGLDPCQCLETANAGSFLEASGDLIQTGPTGTNVMDLAIGVKWVASGEA
jgi:glycerate 2-kinase